MAEKFINYERHGVVEVSALLATNYGAHINNFVADVDIDNGSVVKMGAFVETDYYKAEVPAVGDEVFLIATEPKIYSEYTKKMQEESNFFNGKGTGKWGKPLGYREGLALEPQFFPDAVNHENLSPVPVLRPGEEYHQLCIYKFAVLPKEAKK